MTTPRRRFLLGAAAAASTPPAALGAVLPMPVELTRAAFTPLVGTLFEGRSLVDAAPLLLRLVAVDPLPGRAPEERSFALCFAADQPGAQASYALAHPALATPFGALLVPERGNRMVATFNRRA